MGRIRLSLWPTLFAVPVLAVLIALGVWQLHRHDEKSALLERIEAGLAADSVRLPANIADPYAWDYRRVQVAGVFLHDRELYLTSRSHRGQAGLHVVTPLRRTDAIANDHVILVNRGWVPTDRRDRASRTDGLPAGTVTVSGILRRPVERGWMVPDNEPDANLWFWADLTAMAESAGIAPVPTVILEADVDLTGGALPIGGQTRLDIPNNHLQYAITWFAFAVILMVIYVLYHRRPKDRDHTARPPPHSPCGPEPT